MLAGRIDARAVVNAGDGAHEHPTQALLDCSTIRAHKGRLAGPDRRDLRRHPPQPRRALEHLGAARAGRAVRVAGPRTLLPPGLAEMGVVVHDRLEPALEGADVVMMLRIQKERMGTGLFPNTREYSRYFGLNERRLGAGQARRHRHAPRAPSTAASRSSPPSPTARAP